MVPMNARERRLARTESETARDGQTDSRGRGVNHPGQRLTLKFWRIICSFCFLGPDSLSPDRTVSPWTLGSSRFLSVSATQQDDAFQRGLVAFRENRFDEALKELTAAEFEYPSDPRIHNIRGIVLVQLGRPAEAEEEYRAAIKLDPLLADARRNLGFLYWTQHHFEEARNELQQAVRLSPSDSFAHYYLGRVQLDSQLYAKAFEELDRSQGMWPADAGFLLQVAGGYLALDRRKDAQVQLDRLVKLPLSDAQRVRAASLFISANESEKGIRLLLEISKNNASAPWAQLDLALAYFLAGRFNEVIQQAHSLVDSGTVPRSQTSESAAWSLIGIASAHLGRNDEAIQSLRRATSLCPELEQHWLNLTRLLMELRRYDDALEAVRNGLTSNPASYALYLRRGAANLAAGRYADAEATFRSLVGAGDPLPISYVGLAQVLLRTGRPQDAVAELDHARNMLGPNFLISYFLGLALSRSGKTSEAFTAYQEAVRLNPNSAEAHLGLGKAEFALNRVSEATAEFQQTLRLDPGNVQARRLISHAYYKVGDAEKAAEYLDESQNVAIPPGNLKDDFLLPQWEYPLN
jgi:tetratricopeptide (TPR) repeat protein